MTDLTRLTAVETAAAIASREVSAVEVAQAHLDRIAAVDGAVHAFVVATRLTTAANAIFLQYTAPIYVALLGPWVLGDHYSICDPYLFTLARWLEGDRVEIARFPKVAAHFARIQERPAVGRVLALHTT